MISGRTELIRLDSFNSRSEIWSLSFWKFYNIFDAVQKGKKISSLHFFHYSGTTDKSIVAVTMKKLTTSIEPNYYIEKKLLKPD